MKFNKDKAYLLISFVYIIITGGINIYGYLNLPEKIATQISFSGEQVTHMPKLVYLLVSFAGVLFLTVLGNAKPMQKLKYFLVSTLIVVLNIIIIVTQL